MSNKAYTIHSLGNNLHRSNARQRPVLTVGTDKSDCVISRQTVVLWRSAQYKAQFRLLGQKWCVSGNPTMQFLVFL